MNLKTVLLPLLILSWFAMPLIVVLLDKEERKRIFNKWRRKNTIR